MKELPKPIHIPRWYQDLSVSQMQRVFDLGDIMRADYMERVTGRTQRALGDIGVTSTFVKVTSDQIRELRLLTDLDPVKFLSEIYRIVTGRYFIDEEYKKVYDCNERIILSAIAFLMLPETVIELHSRIPMGEAPKFPPKRDKNYIVFHSIVSTIRKTSFIFFPAVLQKIPPRRRATSPYLEPLFLRSDQLTYNEEMRLWRQQCQAIPVPRAILPPWIKHHTHVDLPTIVESERADKGGKERLEGYHEEGSDKKKDYIARVTSLEKKAPNLHEDRMFKSQERGHKKDHVELTGHENKSREIIEKEAISARLAPNLHEDRIFKSQERGHKKDHVALTGHENKSREIIEKEAISARLDYSKPFSDKSSTLAEKETHLVAAGLHERKAPNSRHDYSKRPYSDKNTWLGEKDTHLIVTGVSENADYPISYETSGLACVTPDNSDESFFAELNLTDDRNKKYARGRDKLSKNWQEWLQAADEEYMKVEKDADKIIKSIKETLKLMGPEISCDICCSCRQTRKANVNYHKTKTPSAVIDSVAVDGTKNKYIVGSLSMNSPAPSPSESTDDLPEVIASHDKIVKSKIISGVTNEKGETKYCISGVSKEVEHVPRKVVSNSMLPKPMKNVPPCGCAIEKMINEGLTTVTSDDDIPRTKTDSLCIGKKYRPKAIGVGSEHPNDKLPSVRISEEYVPEYELYDSPYEMCVRERKDDDFKYMERYLGPQSLMAKKPRASGPCDCSSVKQKIVDDAPSRVLKQNEKESIVKEPAFSAETKWESAFKDEGLVNFYARCRDNVPCWLRCIEFSKDGCCAVPRVLQVKRPVCECKYERKIVKREEEKTNWLRRQEKLKTMKKQPHSQVAGLSRPMRTETNVMISNVTRTHRKAEDIDDIEYCVSGIAQDRVMGPAECILSGVGMHTPLITPEMSKAEIPISKPHRHWSPTNIQAADIPIMKYHRNLSPINTQVRPAASTNVENVQLKEKNETDWRNKLRDKADKRVDVLFQSRLGNIAIADQLERKKPDYAVVEDKKLGKDRTKGKESKAEKLPSIEPAIQQPRKAQTAGSVNAESKKKSSTRELGKKDKSNVHAKKSTGSILSKGTKAELQDKKKEASSKIDLTKLLQIELEKMAGEGFLFAKLPACHQMPQLQYWIMYRKGVAFTPDEKKKLMSQSIKIWKAMEKVKPKKIEASAIEMSEEALENLTFDKAEEIKRDVALKKAMFYSHIRKSRVLQARSMWNLMEFGKFPGVSFKKTYFTYLAGKEADGFVFKPWENKEKNE